LGAVWKATDVLTHKLTALHEILLRFSKWVEFFDEQWPALAKIVADFRFKKSQGISGTAVGVRLII